MAVITYGYKYSLIIVEEDYSILITVDFLLV